MIYLFNSRRSILDWPSIFDCVTTSVDFSLITLIAKTKWPFIYKNSSNRQYLFKYQRAKNSFQSSNWHKNYNIHKLIQIPYLLPKIKWSDVFKSNAWLYNFNASLSWFIEYSLLALVLISALFRLLFQYLSTNVLTKVLVDITLRSSSGLDCCRSKWPEGVHTSRGSCVRQGALH